MGAYPLFMKDGTIIHDCEEFKTWLEDQTRQSTDGLFDGLSDDKSVIKTLEIDRDWYERQCDGYHSELNEFMNEVEDVCEKLESGKRGKGYTKLEIARQLRDSIRSHTY